MQFFKEKVHKAYVNTYNSLTSTLQHSKFLEEGVLTPDEFVAAGDLLVYKCPTWTWEAGDPSKQVSYLPPDKQFLRTRSVPCYKRASSLEDDVESEETTEVSIGDDSGWVATHTEGKLKKAGEEEEDDIPEICTGIAEVELASSSGVEANSDDDSDDDSSIPDMEDYDEENLEDEDEGTLQDIPEDNIIRTRTYDLSITYDKYYQTPKVWLFGYDEQGKPLKTKEIFQDISQDHAQKTVTIDNHPHTGISHAYIHPCKHSSVMKKILQRVAESETKAGEPNANDDGEDTGLRVDQYLFVFLKFISAVIPTIEYDYTNFFFNQG